MGIIGKILKGSLIGLLLMAVLFMTPGMANAMQFSEPVLIGKLGANKNGGLYSKKALPTSIEKVHYDFKSSTGIIRAYLRDSSGNYLMPNRFGSSTDINNTIAMRFSQFNFFYEVAG